MNNSMDEKKGREPKPGLKQIPPATLLTLATLFLAGCSSKQEILESLSPPQINTGQEVYYTRIKNPTLWFAFANTNNLTLSISPDGKAKAEIDGLNQPTGKIRLTLPKKNTVYTLQMTARNCDQPNNFNPICSEEVVQSLRIVRDNIPPNARITDVIAFNGGLKIKYVIDDTLSRPPDYEQFVFFDTPRLGKNTTKVTFSDMAGNTQTQTLEGNYDPFTSAVAIEIAEYDKVSKKILISGTIDNSGANLTAFGISGTQESFPFTYSNSVNCAEPIYPEGHQGKYRFIASCSPTRDNGKVMMSFTLEDVWGNKMQENIKAAIPGLNKTNEVGFYAFWAAAFLSSGYMVARMRGKAYRFKRRGELKQAIAGGDPKLIDVAYSRLTRRDKREFQNPVPFLKVIKKAEFCLSRNNFTDCLRILERLFKRDAEPVRENRNNLLIRTINKINGILANRSLNSLNDHQIRPLIAFLFEKIGGEDFEFLWESVDQLPSEKNNILPALTIYLMQKEKPKQEERQEREILRKKALRLGLSDLNIVKERLPALLEFGDYQSLIEFFNDIDHLYLRQKHKTQLLQLREQVSSTESAQYNNLIALLQAAELELNPQQQESQYNKLLEKLKQYRLATEHQNKIEARIKTRKEDKTFGEIVQKKQAEISTMADEHGIPLKGLLMAKITDAFNYILDQSSREILRKHTKEQINAFIDAVLALEIMPLSYFLGASSVELDGKKLVISGLPPENDKYIPTAFHQDSQKYKQRDNDLLQLMSDLILRIYYDYLHKINEIRASNNGNKQFTHPEIKRIDKAVYQPKSFAFFKHFFTGLNLEFSPGIKGCDAVMTWLEKALQREEIQA